MKQSSRGVTSTGNIILFRCLRVPVKKISMAKDGGFNSLVRHLETNEYFTLHKGKAYWQRKKTARS